MTAKLLGHPTRARSSPRETPHRDPDQSLEHDADVHLRAAVRALDELDRVLHHLAACPLEPPGELDLEAVALARHVVELEPPQRLDAEHPEPRGQVANAGTQ